MLHFPRFARPFGFTPQRLLIAILFVGYGLPLAVAGQESGTAEVAEDYVTAYATGDLETLFSFYTDETLLADPTAALRGQELRLTGISEIRPFMEMAFGAVEDFYLDITGRLVAGPYAVYTGAMYYSVPGEVAGDTAEKVRLNAEFAFVLEIRDGKIVSHTDYVDYDGMSRRSLP